MTQKALAVASDEAAANVFMSILKSCVHAWGRSRWKLNLKDLDSPKLYMVSVLAECNSF